MTMKLQMRMPAILALAIWALWPTDLDAQVSVSLDRAEIVLGETVTLILQTADPQQSLEADLTPLEGDFVILNRRSETQMSYVNGSQTATVKMLTTLEPKRAGVLVIPSMQFPGASTSEIRLKVKPAPTLAPGQLPPVFIELELAPEEGPHYVMAQISLTVRVFYQQNLTEAAMNPPEPEQASVRLLDEVPYQTQRNGKRYRVLERHFAVFPERSGALVIPPLELSGRLVERPSDRLWQPSVRGRRVRIESEPLTLDIQPRPDSYDGEHWLPARQIRLSQQISDNPGLRVGEPVTRTIILDAVGLEENMLEEPGWPKLHAARVYPDQPQGISRDDGNWVLGHKEFRYAVVPETAGELVLPEIRLDWWDTTSNRQRTAVVPEHRVQVLPSGLAAAQPTATNVTGAVTNMINDANATSTGFSNAVASRWRLATGVFAILWLVTLYVALRKAVPVREQQRVDTLPEGEKELLVQLRQACRRGDAIAVRRILRRWVSAFGPHEADGSMLQFAAISGDESLRSLLYALDGGDFRPGEAGTTGLSNADLNGLWKVFSAWQNQWKRNVHRSANSFSNLYPNVPLAAGKQGKV
jgi:hypothetical protein